MDAVGDNFADLRIEVGRIGLVAGSEIEDLPLARKKQHPERKTSPPVNQLIMISSSGCGNIEELPVHLFTRASSIYSPTPCDDRMTLVGRPRCVLCRSLRAT